LKTQSNLTLKVFRDYIPYAKFEKQSLIVGLGGPRARLAKINAGEKQISCPALEARQLVAGNRWDNRFIIAN